MPPKRGAAKKGASAKAVSRGSKAVNPALIQKTVYDNYLKRGLVAADVYVRVVDGVTLYKQTETDLVKKATDPEFVMGGPYFAAKRLLWRDPTHPTKRLKVPEGVAEKVNSHLLKAMVAAKTNVADTALMQAYVGSATVINTTELVGLFKWGHELSISSSKQLSALLDLIRFSNRLDIKNTHADMYALMYDKFISGLVATRARAKRVDAEAFCRLHRVLLTPFVNNDKLDEVLSRSILIYESYVKVVTFLSPKSSVVSSRMEYNMLI
jgi:hypothetical protein